MRITFLGTGTSVGVPMIGCRCDVCRSSDPADKRLRTSVWIEMKGHNIIIDTGIDFRQQALRAGIPTIDEVLFTHHHADHIFGMDDLRPINFLQKKNVRIYANQQTLENLKRVYTYVFNSGDAPSDIPKVDVHIFDDRPFFIDDIEIIPVPLQHGKLRITGFRIGGFAYCTDVSGIPDESYPLLQNLDTLVLGALRDRPHPTHFTIDRAIRESQKISARQTFFVHMSHEISHRQLSERLPSGMMAAYDGLVLELPGF